MKLRKNLFLIITPSQLINALEFINCKRLSPNECSFLLSSTSKNFENQCIQMLDKFGFSDYQSLSPEKKSFLSQLPLSRMPFKLLYLIKAKKKLKKLLENKTFNYTVVGNYSNFIAQYLIQKNKQNIVILDDGTGSATRTLKRKKEFLTGKPFFEFNRKRKLLWLVKLVMGFNKNFRIPQKLCFFTNYSFETVGDDFILENEYNFLKSKLSEKPVDINVVYLLGSPLSESGYIDQDVELSYIQRIIDGTPGKLSVQYIPHRLDSISKLDKIDKLLPIKRFDLPIEISLAMEHKIPKSYFGFFTSALPNLSDILGTDFDLISFEIESYNNETLEKRAQTVYSNFKENFSCIKVEPIK